MTAQTYHPPCPYCGSLNVSNRSAGGLNRREDNIPGRPKFCNECRMDFYTLEIPVITGRLPKTPHGRYWIQATYRGPHQNLTFFRNATKDYKP